MRTILFFISSLLLTGLFYRANFAYSEVSNIANDLQVKEVPLDTFHLTPPIIPHHTIRTKRQTFWDVIVKVFTDGSSYPYAKDFSATAQLEDDFPRRVRQVINPRHDGPLNLGQICDIFDYLLSNRRYINDPKGREYFTKPTEYWEDHSGDCDDQAICASVAMSAIGCFSRIVLAQGSRTGHAYAEVYLGSNLIDLQKYIIYLHRRYPESKRRSVFFYTDKDGSWLNIDISATYPGSSPFKGDRYHLYYPMYEHWYDYYK